MSTEKQYINKCSICKLHGHQARTCGVLERLAQIVKDTIENGESWTSIRNGIFQMIKETSKQNPNTIISAYKDNVAFIEGPSIEQFAPEKGDVPSSYQKQKIETVISLKAETHNFPTTVEPFNGAGLVLEEK